MAAPGAAGGAGASAAPGAACGASSGRPWSPLMTSFGPDQSYCGTADQIPVHTFLETNMLLIVFTVCDFVPELSPSL